MVSVDLIMDLFIHVFIFAMPVPRLISDTLLWGVRIALKWNSLFYLGLFPLGMHLQ